MKNWKKTALLVSAISLLAFTGCFSNDQKEEKESISQSEVVVSNATDTKAVAKKGYASISFEAGIHSGSMLKGKTVKAYKNGIFYKDYTIGTAEYYTPFLGMENLPFGNYKLVLDQRDRGRHFVGSVSFTVSSKTSSVSTCMNVTNYADLSVRCNFSKSLNISKTKLYQNGKLLKESPIIYVKFALDTSYYDDLLPGQYKVVFDELSADGKFKSYGELDFSISETATPVEPITLSANSYTISYPNMNIRGTFNNWDITQMKIVANNTWESVVTFPARKNGEFKFAPKSDWSISFGDNNKDFTANLNEGNIIVAGGATYKITFNDLTKKYSVVKQ